MSGDLFWLSDAQFAKIEPLLPTKVRGVKPHNSFPLRLGFFASLR